PGGTHQACHHRRLPHHLGPDLRRWLGGALRPVHLLHCGRLLDFWQEFPWPTIIHVGSRKHVLQRSRSLRPVLERDVRAEVWLGRLSVDRRATAVGLAGVLLVDWGADIHDKSGAHAPVRRPFRPAAGAAVAAERLVPLWGSQAHPDCHSWGLNLWVEMAYA